MDMNNFSILLNISFLYFLIFHAVWIYMSQIPISVFYISQHDNIKPSIEYSKKSSRAWHAVKNNDHLWASKG